jgi:hypothetical protein
MSPSTDATTLRPTVRIREKPIAADVVRRL